MGRLSAAAMRWIARKVHPVRSNAPLKGKQGWRGRRHSNIGCYSHSCRSESICKQPSAIKRRTHRTPPTERIRGVASSISGPYCTIKTVPKQVPSKSAVFRKLLILLKGLLPTLLIVRHPTSIGLSTHRGLPRIFRSSTNRRVKTAHSRARYQGPTLRLFSPASARDIKHLQEVDLAPRNHGITDGKDGPLRCRQCRPFSDESRANVVAQSPGAGPRSKRYLENNCRQFIQRRGAEDVPSATLVSFQACPSFSDRTW